MCANAYRPPEEACTVQHSHSHSCRDPTPAPRGEATLAVTLSDGRRLLSVHPRLLRRGGARLVT